MKIGEKIKKLRNEKSMTQSELAGKFITRNMLSLIESGSAQPSLPTIIYLAKRLNVPAGILVADDNDEYFYRRMTLIGNIRKAYSAGNYRICLEMCDSAGGDVHDDEIELISAECLLEVAKEEFFEGNLKLASKYFDSACEHASSTIYNTLHIESESAVYCIYMRDAISPTIYSECAESTISSCIAMENSFCRYAISIKSLLDEKEKEAEEYISSLSEDDIYAQHIRAKINMRNSNCGEGKQIMLSILNSTQNLPSPMIYDIFKDLEICCRETGDFKGAYEYASSKVGLLQRLLDEEESL